jgi:hypothetical protein
MSLSFYLMGLYHDDVIYTNSYSNSTVEQYSWINNANSIFSKLFYLEVRYGPFLLAEC